MPDEVIASVGDLVARANSGDAGATRQFFTLLYRQLHWLAQRDAGRLVLHATLGAASLCNDAYLVPDRKVHVLKHVAALPSS